MEKGELQAMLAEGLSLERMGEMVGRDPSTVSYWMRKHGLEAVNRERHAARGGLDRAELERAVKAGMSIAELAEAFERSKGTIRHWLGRYGLSTKNRVGSAKRDALEGDRTRQTTITGRCHRHGEVEFVREGASRFRCRQCRMDFVNRRRRKVKAILVAEAGGCCCICGYDRSIVALQFHHLDPTQKVIAISGRCLAIDTLREEVSKCVLLCSNCHAEVEAGLAAVPSVLADADRGLPPSPEDGDAGPRPTML